MRVRNVPVAIRTVVRGALPRWQSESFSPLSIGYSAVVDYQKREVLLARALPEGQADFTLPMRMNRLPMVRGLLNSTHPAYFVVDTGGELISISAETALALAMPPVRRIPLRVFGMSGVDENAFLLPGVNLDFDEIEYPERRPRRAELARAEHPPRLPARWHRRPPVPVGLPRVA